MEHRADIFLFEHRIDTIFKDQYLDFIFNPNVIPTHPVEARIPTPSMVWVTVILN